MYLRPLYKKMPVDDDRRVFCVMVAEEKPVDELDSESCALCEWCHGMGNKQVWCGWWGYKNRVLFP